MESKPFPAFWQVSERRKREERMFVVDRNVLTFEKQETLFDTFKRVGYANHAKRVLWRLVGHGKPYFDCGTVKVKGCDRIEAHANNRVFGRYYKRNCMRKACPECFEGWAGGEAERSLIRIASFVGGSSNVQQIIDQVKREFVTKARKTLHKELVSELEILIKSFAKLRNELVRPIHVVVSPPPGVDWASYPKMRKFAYRIVKESGLQGGLCIPHPYRIRCQKCHASIPDYEKSCVKCGGSGFEWFFSPHFHFVGVGYIHGTAEGYSRHHWIVKNLGVRDSVYATLQYILSHAGDSKYHTTTWFGLLAYNILRHVAVLGVCREICPVCGSGLRPLKWIRLDRPPPLEYSEIPAENDFYALASDWRSY